VNTVQRRTMCPTGDEDWLFFGGVRDKVYTIDVPRQDPGIDLSLEVLDSNLNRIAFNDDFFNRNPPNPSDTRPRITLRIPADGSYFIKVRDNAGRGGQNYFYEIALLSESFGPTPTTVTEVCLDIFEPDGLPEQARFIGPNELQENHALCPTGDADWVRFFGAAGKRYIFFTDTRRYRGANQVNQDTQAGADTILYLYDRDGVSQIDVNDDIAGGNTLDSQIEFTPAVDGFYFAQVKNRGDIGNRFIRYDFTLLLCLPGQTDCGRTSSSPPRSTPAPVPTNPVPTGTAATAFALDPTRTPTRTPTPRAAGSQDDQQAAAAAGFADVAFQRLWQRSDLPIASQQTVRSWMWGPAAMTMRDEEYRQSSTGTRRVQYFDKARMEINNPVANRSDPGFVTNGLLVTELVSGRMQVGDNEFNDRQAAAVVIAGDTTDPNGPTYASFQALVAERSPNLTGEEVGVTLSRDGQVGRYSGTRYEGARLVHFVPETGHNIPEVFWRFLNSRGLVYGGVGGYRDDLLMEWESVVGFPISEAYWVRVNVGGRPQDVLVQPFQRRVLTYTPANPAGWQVEMGNVGRHYYEWRYGQPLP
jgi:hypothetical protein